MSRKDEARQLLSTVEKEYQTENIGAYPIARVYFILGEAEAAFQWLEKSLDEHDGNIMLMGVAR